MMKQKKLTLKRSQNQRRSPKVRTWMNMTKKRKKMKRTMTDPGKRKERRGRCMISLFKKLKLMTSQKMMKNGKKVRKKLELSEMKSMRLVLLLEKLRAEGEERIYGSK